MNDVMVSALGELAPAELDAMISEFFTRAEQCLAVGQDGWASVYAAVAVCGVKALQGAD